MILILDTKAATFREIAQERAWQARQDSAWAPRWLSLLQSSYQDAGAAYGASGGQMRAVDAAIAAYDRPTETLVSAEWRAIASESRARSQGQLKAHWDAWELKVTEEEVWAQELDQFIRTQTGEKMVQVSDTTKAFIKRQVQIGIDNGLGVQAIATRITQYASRRTLESLAQLYNPFERARVVARTENHYASNFGQHKAAEASKIKLARLWIATHDKRVRTSHIAAEMESGQSPVGLQDLFKVGNAKLKYPGDQQGHGSKSDVAKETIQCRCFLAFRRIREAAA